ncbi:hypothetical protein [Mycolicibacterium sp. CR10]|uniref:hypothetical protein n=1 Tax=Mycolicibacterium sp. CR10 TaxID=2562314 RepID=UPI0010C02F33|nr:hypothetical protein [Mycolicibacterium sp. CR10]
MDTIFVASAWDWVWERHLNVLSWYIRPLFLLPLALFAYRRSGWGIAATLAALATSMVWFPAPSRPDPGVREFLEFEKQWLTGDWTVGKFVLSLLVPVALAAYCLAFWRRSLAWGLVVLNAMAFGKLAWGVLAGAGTGWAMAAPALIGLLVGDVVLVVALLWSRRRRRLEAHQRI